MLLTDRSGCRPLPLPPRVIAMLLDLVHASLLTYRTLPQASRDRPGHAVSDHGRWRTHTELFATTPEVNEAVNGSTFCSLIMVEFRFRGASCHVVNSSAVHYFCLPPPPRSRAFKQPSLDMRERIPLLRLALSLACLLIEALQPGVYRFIAFAPSTDSQSNRLLNNETTVVVPRTDSPATRQ